MDAIRTHDVCDFGNSFKFFPAEHLWSSVHIVQDASVDADGCVEARIFLYKFYRHRLAPMPDRPSGITSFYSVVKVVPMVEDTALVRRFFSDVENSICLSSSFKALKGICTVHRTDVSLGHDLSSFRGVLDHEAVIYQVERLIYHDLRIYLVIFTR